MRYFLSIFRISLLIAMVLALGHFSDVKKVKAVDCNIIASRTLDATDTTCEGQAVTISGTGVVVTVSGAHTFTNLTITNGAKVTQEAIAVSDLNADGKTFIATGPGPNKKVDLTVIGTLSLTNQGRIDVSGKGFPGGGFSGYGPGSGPSSSGAYGSDVYHSAYGSEDQPTDNGSGGGEYGHSPHGPGGAGGGVIKIHANDMTLDYNSQTFISANGSNAAAVNQYTTTYFGGSGGSIWLQVTGTLTTHTDPSFNLPSVTSNGSTSTTVLNGTMKITGTSEHFGEYIVANGGWSGGTGGRIRIEVANVTHPTTCNIAGGDSIPAYCEGKDVTVSSTTINMNKVQVKPSGSNWVDCSSDATKSNNTACDSKRHFTSLTVENGATITHEALTRADIDLDGKTVNRTAGTARWKKVDIDVGMGTITLRSGGKIDVDGKGYPSYELDPVPDVGALGFGPGAGRRGTCTDDRKCASGGGYGGEGGSGDGGSPPLGGGTYGESLEPDDFGSGAGPASYGTDSIGGGGKIKIIANSILIKDSSSKITANGADQLGFSSESPGGASGGSIWLSANTINTPAVSTILDGCGTETILNYALAGKGITCSPRGEDAGMGTLMINWELKANGSGNKPDDPYYTNIFANGGNIGRDGGAGGGGRIAIGPGPTLTPTVQTRKVNVKVKWTENGQPKEVNFSEILSGIAP